MQKDPKDPQWIGGSVKAIVSKGLLEDEIIESRAYATELKEAANELASRVDVYYERSDGLQKASEGDTF